MIQSDHGVLFSMVIPIASLKEGNTNPNPNRQGQRIGLTSLANATNLP